MDYEFDVFVSYPRAFPVGVWVRDHLVTFLKPALRQQLNREPRFFIDSGAIRDGDNWRKRIYTALARSRILLAVLSADYFLSEWCQRECAVMLYRARQLGLNSFADPSGLVMGIVAGDGEHYPEYMQALQTSTDMRSFVRVGSGFKKTTRYVKMQDAIEKAAESVALLVKSAPNWQQEWLEEEWLTDAVSRLKATDPKYTFYGLQ